MTAALTAVESHRDRWRAGLAARRPETQVDVVPLTPTIGAELRGLDLALDLDDAQIELLRDAVDEHGVVFLRGQYLDAEQHRRLASRFGSLTVHPVSRRRGVDEPLSVIADSAEHPPAAFPWHTDLSWLPAPPALGFLAALQIPATGGDTLWASGAAVLERLHPATVSRCRGLRVLHAPDPRLIATIRRHHGDEVADGVLAEHPPVSHPLVRVHERTGREGLFLSPLSTTTVEGWGEDDGAALLAELAVHLDDPAVQVRWRWQEGDVAIWDETSTVHRALADHFPQPRRMRRCAVDGGVPVGSGRASRRRAERALRLA